MNIRQLQCDRFDVKTPESGCCGNVLCPKHRNIPIKSRACKTLLHPSVSMKRPQHRACRRMCRCLKITAPRVRAMPLCDGKPHRSDEVLFRRLLREEVFLRFLQPRRHIQDKDSLCSCWYRHRENTASFYSSPRTIAPKIPFTKL